MNQEFLNRIKSFIWRIAMVALVAIVEYASDNLGILGWSPQITGLIGLGLGEVSKYLNKKYQIRKSKVTKPNQ